MLSLSSKFHQAEWQNNLTATPDTTQWGTRLTAHATPHSKGAYATLMTTTYDVYGFWVGVSGTATTATDTDMLLDIATGAAQENIIVPEFLCGGRGPAASAAPVALFQWFPIFIPRGTIVSGRIQALITVDIADVLMIANGGASAMPGPLFSGCDAYGTTVASSSGTSHTPGNTGAESTAANVGGTATRDYGAVALGHGIAGTAMNTLAYHFEIQLGAVTLCEYYTGVNSLETVLGPFPPAPFHASIPFGSQLQIRGECSGIAQAQDIAFYCFY